MSSESENFEQVRRALALKRHEQPPPGYFNGFSRQVIGRIKAGDLGQEDSWWQRISAMFEVKPAFAGAFGAAVCLILVAGVLNSEESGVSSPLLGAGSVQGSVQGLGAQDSALGVAEQPIVVAGSSSTAVLSNLFEHFQANTQPVGFALPRQ